MAIFFWNKRYASELDQSHLRALLLLTDRLNSFLKTQNPIHSIPKGHLSLLLSLECVNSPSLRAIPNNTFSSPYHRCHTDTLVVLRFGRPFLYFYMHSCLEIPVHDRLDTSVILLYTQTLSSPQSLFFDT